MQVPISIPVLLAVNHVTLTLMLNPSQTIVIISNSISSIAVVVMRNVVGCVYVLTPNFLEHATAKINKLV